MPDLKEFGNIVNPILQEMQKKYHLGEWMIHCSPVKQLEGRRVGEVTVDPAYRWADISYLQSSFKKASVDEVQTIIEHEVQHVALYPLDELMSVVKNGIQAIADTHEEADGACSALIHQLEQQSVLTNEKLRSMLGRVTGRGNNFW